MSRGAGLKRIPWVTVVDLDISRASVAHYTINEDMAYVDRRCILRYIRRARVAARGPLKEWWIRRLRAMERAL